MSTPEQKLASAIARRNAMQRIAQMLDHELRDLDDDINRLKRKCGLAVFGEVESEELADVQPTTTYCDCSAGLNNGNPACHAFACPVYIKASRTSNPR